MKKILYFHQYFSTRSGATGTRSYEFAIQLIKAGYQVTMVCGSSSLAKSELNTFSTGSKRIYNVDGIHVIEFDINYSNNNRLLLRAWKFLQFTVRCLSVLVTEKYDLILATSTPLTVGIPGILGKYLLRKKFIFEVRDLWPELPRAMRVVKNKLVLLLLDWLETLSYRAADQLIGLSPGIVEGIKKKVPNKKITLISNGCDLDLFFPQKNKSLKIDGIEPGDFVATFTGAHGLANGLESIIEVAAILQKKKLNHIKFLFIGDGIVKPKLQLSCQEQNLTNCIFLPPMSKNKLNEYLNFADVGLMVLKNIPEFYNGTSPNKFFDYLSAGLPVLNNYPGWLSDIIISHNIGEIAPPNDNESFAAILTKMSLMDEQKLLVMSRNARLLAESEFNRETLAKMFISVIESAF